MIGISLPVILGQLIGMKFHVCFSVIFFSFVLHNSATDDRRLRKDTLGVFKCFDLCGIKGHFKNLSCSNKTIKEVTVVKAACSSPVFTWCTIEQSYGLNDCFHRRYTHPFFCTKESMHTGTDSNPVEIQVVLDAAHLIGLLISFIHVNHKCKQ